MTTDDLSYLLTEARSRTIELIADLTDEQILGPQLDIVNPPLWEIGHVAWFQDKWTLCHLRQQKPILKRGDSLYDSAAVSHDTRWNLGLPSREDTLEYMMQVLEEVVGRIGSDVLSEKEAYFHLLPLYHEYMHSEAITYTRQTLGYPAPGPGIVGIGNQGDGVAADTLRVEPQTGSIGGGSPDRLSLELQTAWLAGDAEVPGGCFYLGATRDEPFVFDNEKWAHRVELAPFKIARATVTNAEFAEFAEAGGYRRESYWSDAGWGWRSQTKAEHPVYWQRGEGGRWLCRHFQDWKPLEEHLPIIHVNWYEAEAFCRWAGRRLPSEAEWEMAASGPPRETGRQARFPWGDEGPTPDTANLEWRAMGCIPVGALPASDSRFGCRQMIGNVWEWTADDFKPYPGFVVDPYKEYSAPWFGDHKVLRGGCWTTRARLIRNTWRNFYKPDRRDVLAGFRTCAPG